MDHLKTSDERKARWYSRDVQPRILPIERAKKWSDLLSVPPYDSTSPCSKLSQTLQSSDNPLPYEFVYSLPFEWLAESNRSLSTHEVDPCKPEAANDRGSRPDNILKKVLETHGFAVIAGVISEAECSEALDLAWDWMEASSAAEYQNMQQQCSNINSSSNGPTNSIRLVHRNDVTTHQSSPRTAYPRTVEGGLMPFYGSGHSTLAWKVRSHPAVRKVFASLYCNECDDPIAGTNDTLLSSLDGFVLWTERSMLDSEDAGWFHVDQNPIYKPGHAAVQGLVNLVPVSPTTGGNALVVQSHVDFAKGHFVSPFDSAAAAVVTTSSLSSSHGDTVRAFYKQRLDEIGNDDWLEIDPNDSLLLRPNRIVSLLLGAGDILLWDSRVAHCSYPPPTSMEHQHGGGMTHLPSKSRQGFVRAATLVSMMPMGRCFPSLSSSGILQARKQAVEECRTLTHWINKAAPLGEERPDDVTKERTCVDYMFAHDERGEPKVLLGWEDLTVIQKGLVVGKEYL